MPTSRKPIIGAILLAGFITLCVGWLFHGAGVSLPWWSYPLVFSLFALGNYAIAGLLLGPAQGDGRKRSFGNSIEE